MTNVMTDETTNETRTKPENNEKRKERKGKEEKTKGRKKAKLLLTVHYRAPIILTKVMIIPCSHDNRDFLKHFAVAMKVEDMSSGCVSNE